MNHGSENKKTTKKLKSPFGNGTELGKKRDCKQNAVLDNFSLTNEDTQDLRPQNKTTNAVCKFIIYTS